MSFRLALEDMPLLEAHLNVNDIAKKTFPFSILSKRPKRMDVKPTVPIPTVKVALK